MDPSVEMIPMWIADMDFRSPFEVVEAVCQRARAGCYGYTTKPESIYNAVIRWVKERYGWEVKKEWIVFTPGVIPGFNIAIQNLTRPGDGVIVQTPVYYPFMEAALNNNRKLVSNPLVEQDGKWQMDFEDLERKVKDPNNRLMILCNPHNPVGRAWTKEELCAYVDANMDYMKAFIDERLPELKMEKPEATYMVWVDFRGTGMSTQEIEKFIIQKARIGVDMGSWFGAGGAGYLRFNLACQRKIVEQALARLEQVLRER